MPSLSQILNEKIGEGGKSKAYVADKLKVSERTIENYMKGTRNPKPDALVELSKLLGFSLDDLGEQNVQAVRKEREVEEESWSARVLSIAESVAKAHEYQSKANHEQSEANRRLSETNKKLSEELVNYKTLAKSPLSDPATLNEFLGLLAGIASGETRFRSRQEAVAALNKFSYAGQASQKKMGKT